MKILGGLLIAFGLVLCITIIFLPWGMFAIAAGALLIIASAVVRRQRAQEELAREAHERRPGVANSQFGR